MRRYQQKQILQLIETLQKTAGQIEDLFAKNECSAMVALLADCQNTALNIGNFIEEIKGEGTRTVSLLEEYCELLYRVSEQQTASGEQGASLVKSLKIQLDAIKDTVRKELKPTGIEVAFFPYKASMWDSLESVWRAAESDENCEAFVVPIPYYDRLPDGTFGQMHEERELYPQDVPVVDWRVYDVEARHPDIVFIHSPYDGGNFVTSIHPYFYSKHLKKNTDLLVYIPYFVSFGVIPDSMCITVGSLNADRVILESEAVRQMYIEALQRCAKGHSKKIRENAVQKFQAFGSPKYDKIVHSKREDFCLPEKWKILMQGSGGGQKKVIFYNTSLQGILRGGSRYLKKLQSVLEIFKKQKEAVCWWRPHPLSEAAFRSMRPRLFEEYERIVHVYRQEGWGIYDDTSDLHRAIAWCDGYYGDISSVMGLFLTAKKPVMLQAVEEFPISFETMIRAQDSYWFTAFDFNGLFRLGEQSNRSDFMGCFPEEKDGFRMFFSIARHENMLIFVPFSAEGIAVYRMDTEKFIHIPLEKPGRHLSRQVLYSEQRKFCVCTICGQDAFFFPCTYPAIVKLDLNTLEVTYLYEPIAELDRAAKHKGFYYFRKGEAEGNTVRLWCAAAGAMTEFDMELCRWKLCVRLGPKEEYVDMVCGNEYNWLLPAGKKRKILKASKDFKQIWLVDAGKGIVSESLPFLEHVVLEDEIFLFPGTAESVIKIKENSNETEEVHLFDGEHMEEYGGLSTDWKFFLAQKSDRVILAFNNFTHQLVVYDPETGRAENKSIMVEPKSRMSRKRFLEAWKTHFAEIAQESDLVVHEDRRMVLETFLDVLANGAEELIESFCGAWEKTLGKDSRRMNGICGRSVYEYARKCLQEE